MLCTEFGWRHLTLKAPQPHFTDGPPRQWKCGCSTHLSGLQQPGVMRWGWSVAPSRSHLLVQQLYRSHGPGERSTVRQWRTVRGTVGDGEGHAMQGAAGRGDLAERHHCWGDEARGEVGGVGGQEERALLGRVSGRAGGGRGGAGAPAGAALEKGTCWSTEGRAGVLRRRSLRRTFSSSSAGKRAESLRRALRGAGFAQGGGEHPLLLRAVGVSVQQRRDLLNREPLKKQGQILSNRVNKWTVSGQ